MSKCEFCGNDHDGTYGSGRFCCPTCARKFSNTFVSESGRENQIKALNNKENREKAKESNNIRVKSNINKGKRKQYRDDLRPKFKHTLTLGKIGELEVSKKFIEHGYNVYTPLVDVGDGIDLVVSNGNGFKTVQVKSSTESKINNSGICETTAFTVCQNVRHIHEGTYTQTKEKYSPEKVNYIALYSAYDDETYLIENSDDISLNITIRNTKSISGQKKKVRYAEDYQIDNVLDKLNLVPGIYYEDDIIDSEFVN